MHMHCAYVVFRRITYQCFGGAIMVVFRIRELTNHAVELFALKALQGEIITDLDPYTIPQAGYVAHVVLADYGSCAWGYN